MMFAVILAKGLEDRNLPREYTYMTLGASLVQVETLVKEGATEVRLMRL